MKKQILLYSLIAASISLLAFMREVHLPKLERWLLSEIYLYSYEQLPVIIDIDQLNLKLFPVGVKLQNISLKAKKEIQDQVQQVEIGSIELSLSNFQLLLGNFEIAKLKVENANIAAKIIPSKEETPQWLKDLKFNDISKLPFNMLEFKNINLNISYLENNIISNKLYFHIKNSGLAMGALLAASDNTVRSPSLAKEVVFSVHSKALLNDQNLSLNESIVKILDSKIESDISIDFDFDKKEYKKTSLEMNYNLQAKQLNELYQSLFPQQKKLFIDGKIQGESNLSFVHFDNIKGKNSIQGQNLKIDQYKIGKLETEMKFEPNKYHLQKLSIEHQKLKLSAQDLILFKQNQEWFLDTKLQVLSLELRQLLDQLNIPDTPLHLEAQGSSKCSGPIYPNLEISCDTQVQTKNTAVYSDYNSKTLIVAYPAADATGKIVINNKEVKILADVNMPKSKGKVNGQVSYENGFEFFYDSPNFNFSDLSNLANLKLSGTSSISGSTKGDSSSGTIAMKIQAKNIDFENYWFDYLQSEIEYKKSVLSFTQLNAGVGNTQVKGNLDIYLNDSSLKAQLNSSFINMIDIKKAIQKQLVLPESFLGTGAAKIEIQGPLDIKKINFKLQSHLINPKLFGENFDRMDFHLDAVNGDIKATKVRALKANAITEYIGQISREHKWQGKLRGNKWQIKNTNFIKDISNEISGLAEFDVKIEGPLGQPLLSGSANLEQTQIASQKIEDSKIKLNLDSNLVSTRMNLFGNKVLIDIDYPLNNTKDFHLKSKITNWNFSPFFALLSKDLYRDTYETDLDMSLELKAKANEIKKSSGKIVISKINIQRGSLSMKNESQFSAEIQRGVLSFPEFILSGTGTYFKLFSIQSSPDNLNLNLNGKLNVALLAFMMPFLQDIRGESSISVQVSGSSKKPELLGSIFSQNMYLKLNDFPHAFENIKADLLFSQNKLIVNSIQSSLAGGSMLASGSILFQKWQQIPIDLDIQLKNANFDVPKGVELKTSGDLKLTGNWFPYKLSGLARISEGKITKASGDESISSVPNELLPQTDEVQNFQALEFDINAIVENKVRIENAFVNTAVNGNLQLLGPVNKPGIVGSINTIRGGKLFFRDTPFDIINGNILFKSANDFNPELFITAETEIKDLYGESESYNVSLLLTGKLKNPVLKLSSQPALSENDIISLLVLGITSNQFDEKPTASGSQQAYKLGSMLLSNTPLNKEFEKVTGLKANVSSTVDESTKQAALQAEVSRQWNPRFSTSARRVFNDKGKTDFKAEYKIKNNVSAIGSWQSQDIQEESSTSKKNETDIFGLDLEFKLEF